MEITAVVVSTKGQNTALVKKYGTEVMTVVAELEGFEDIKAMPSRVLALRDRFGLSPTQIHELYLLREGFVVTSRKSTTFQGITLTGLALLESEILEFQEMSQEEKEEVVREILSQAPPRGFTWLCRRVVARHQATNALYLDEILHPEDWVRKGQDEY
ncbi:MAG: hypothetical protein ACOCU8_01210 [Patescibacteria group bacterium]